MIVFARVQELKKVQQEYHWMMMLRWKMVTMINKGVSMKVIKMTKLWQLLHLREWSL